MAADRKLTVQIVGDSKSAEKAFARVNKAATGFGSKMKSLGKLAAVGVGAAFVGLGLILRKGFKEFMQAQAVMAQTGAVLKSTGGAANVTAKHVDRLAGSLSRMSGIDDEAIASSENLLLTFTNIRNGLGKGNKIFDGATRAVLDMSVAMGKDLPSTAIMVGKALNDLSVNTRGTITGWSALRRVGVQITPQMMAMAAAFIKAGKPMKAQQLLLRELNTEFGGSAAAFGSTLPGAFAKFRNATDEVTGAFAQGLAPVVQRVATLLSNKMANPAFVERVRALGRVVGEKLMGAFVRVSQWFSTNWPAIVSGFTSAWEIAKSVATAVERIAGALERVVAAARKANEFTANLPGGEKGGHGVLGQAWKVISTNPLLQTGYSAPGEILGPKKKGGGGAAPNKHVNRRAFGGRVMRGATYTVGERGMEMFTPATSGRISPNGGGGININGPVYVTAGNVRQLADELTRYSRNRAGQTRGRFGGSKLALG